MLQEKTKIRFRGSPPDRQGLCMHVTPSLAEVNDLSELADLAKFAHDAGQRVDVEPATRRLIIYK